MRKSASGKLVVVNAFQPEHINSVYEAVQESIPELSRYETWAHSDFTRDEAGEYVSWWRKMWKQEKAYYFAVEDPHSGEFLGSCGLSDLSVEHRRASLGFWIRSGRTGRGFATGAARAVMKFGFYDLGLNRIEIEAAVDNKPSRRIAEKLGCQLEGILRRRLILPVGPVDTAMYSLVKDDIPENSSSDAEKRAYSPRSKS
jgi:RimJ/RimL family protein N-acetyltransferase